MTPPRTLADPRLRAVLWLDAAGTAVFGLAALLAAVPLAPLLGAPVPALVAVGAFLVVFAAGVAVTAARPAIPATALTAIVVINAVWAVGSVAVVLLADLSGLGVVVVLAQAVVVALFAELQYLGRRRALRGRGGR